MSRGAVLVTGGTGFVGAHVAAELDRQGYVPRLFDLAPTADALDRIDPRLAERCAFIAADVTDRRALAQAMAGAIAVVHLAGLMTVDCQDDPVAASRVNLLGGQTVIAAAVEARIERFIYASSSAVYGQGDGRLPAPQTLYGVHKLALEGMACVAAREQGLTSAGFRAYIVYGAGESRGIAAGPSIALRAAALGQSATIKFSGSVGFVHVEDVARAMVAAITDAELGAHVHDLHGVSAEVSEFVELLRRQCPGARIGMDGAKLLTPERLLGGENPGWLTALPVTSLPEGIDRTLAVWKSLAGSDGLVPV